MLIVAWLSIEQKPADTGVNTTQETDISGPHSINPVQGESLILFEHQSRKWALESPGSYPNPLPLLCKQISSQILSSSGKWVFLPSGWSRADPHALWDCRGLFGRMWTQCPVSYRRGWPETYWILGAEPGALGQSGRLRLSCVGLELGHLQEPKPGVLSAEDGPHPGLLGWGWAGKHLQCCYQPWLFCGYSQGVVLRWCLL